MARNYIEEEETELNQLTSNIDSELNLLFGIDTKGIERIKFSKNFHPQLIYLNDYPVYKYVSSENNPCLEYLSDISEG
jgi:hypothetical protein